MEQHERVFIVRVRVDRSAPDVTPIRGTVVDVRSGETLRTTSVQDLVDFITLRVDR